MCYAHLARCPTCSWTIRITYPRCSHAITHELSPQACPVRMRRTHETSSQCSECLRRAYTNRSEALQTNSLIQFTDPFKNAEIALDFQGRGCEVLNRRSVVDGEYNWKEDAETEDEGNGETTGANEDEGKNLHFNNGVGQTLIRRKSHVSTRRRSRCPVLAATETRKRKGSYSRRNVCMWRRRSSCASLSKMPIAGEMGILDWSEGERRESSLVD